MAPFAAVVVAAITAAISSSAVDAQDSAQAFLDPHNVAPLAWDDTVAAYAQAFATKRKGDCTLVHSGGPYGENLFWGSAGGNIFLGAGGSDAWDALNSWIGQKQYYDCSTNSCRSREACGDYTQLAWANSTRVGCASVACDAGGTFIACNYDPPGNVPGQRPYLGCATADINPPGRTSSEDIQDLKSVLLDPYVIRAATQKFSEGNKLGKRGFGEVYKGLMPDGQEIAVKRLARDSKQGLHELKNELLLVAKLQHRNLVKLIGACLDGEEKLLVYEYIPNKSLDSFIYDNEKRDELSWDTRYKIICGIARGLVYLHDESRVKVIHRDLKPSNILLEMDMNPKISDFGLASVFEDDHSKHVTRRVAGTYGYMAPEYVVLGHVSTKSDVFSFGVIILEIVTGRRNIVSSSETMMAQHLLSYVWENWTRGTITEIIDPSLRHSFAENMVLKCTHIGLLCVQENPSDRPNMSNVTLMLVGRSTTLPGPSRPAFLFRLDDDTNQSHHGGTIDRPGCSNKPNLSFNEVTITKLEPR